jgi:hypothetical protein
MRATSSHPLIPSRRGIATLEFVMAMPVLLLLMVGLTWLGYSVIGQSEVIVEARNKAWQKKFTNAADNPLIFPSAKGVYSRDKDYVTGTASKQVNVSNVFKGIPGPSSTHTILAGSWDHTAMPLSDPPNKKLIISTAISGRLGKLQISLGNFENLLGNVQNMAGSTIGDAMTEGSGFSGATGSEGEGAKDQTEKEQQAEKLRLQAQYADLTKQINETSSEINGLRADYAKLALSTETDPDKKEENRKEMERISREIDLLKATQERLESQRTDVRKELEAIDG